MSLKRQKAAVMRGRNTSHLHCRTRSTDGAMLSSLIYSVLDCDILRAWPIIGNK